MEKFNKGAFLLFDDLSASIGRWGRGSRTRLVNRQIEGIPKAVSHNVKVQPNWV